MGELVAGLAGPLALVVGLVFLSAAVWRRVRGGAVRRKGTPPAMELVQRLAIGPKQGLALVRIEGQLFAVGTGEGLSITPVGAASLRPESLTPSAVVPLDAFGPADSLSVSPIPGRVAALRTTTLPAGPSAPVMPAFVTTTTRSTASDPASRQAPRATTALDANGDVRVSLAPRVRKDLQDVLRTALRSATTLGVLGLLTLAPAMLPAQAPATAAPRLVAPVTTAPTPGQPPAPAAPAAPGTATTPATTPAAKGPAALSAMQTTEQVISRLAPQMDLNVGGTPGKSDGLRLSGTVGVVVMMGLLTLLPTLLLLMTGFARILIVLGFVRQAIGAQSAPPTQLLAALALLLTGFVMAPTLEEANRTALQPWLAGQIEQAEMMETAVKPFRAFMLRQTRDKDIETFLELSRTPEPATPEEIPLVVLASAFTTSELRTAFQMGFAIFLPFIVVDMVVSSVLMSMGMYMLPPAMIALPFKLLLFVLVDGWTLVVQSLVQSFR